MLLPHLLSALLSLFLIAFLTTTFRLLALLPSRRPTPRPRRRDTKTHLLIVLGSGGHTAEMFALLKGLDAKSYNRRTYVFSSGDALSAAMVKRYEARIQDDNNGNGSGGAGEYELLEVPRARKIHQSLLTTPASALRSLFACLKLLREGTYGYPDLILTNGPGTAVILILASLILRFFDVKGAQSEGKMRSIYVESWARVKRLSLSGKLLLKVVDRFLVQWEELEGVGGRGEYLGVLV